MKRIILILTIAALFTACGKKEKTEVITIASEKSYVDENGQKECFLVKRDGYNDWELWCNDIEGFDYQKGNEYVLRIREKQVVNAAGQPVTHYVLVKEISKVGKESENMPLRKIKEEAEEIIEDIKEGIENI